MKGVGRTGDSEPEPPKGLAAIAETILKDSAHLKRLASSAHLTGTPEASRPRTTHVRPGLLGSGSTGMNEADKADKADQADKADKAVPQVRVVIV